MASGAIVGAMIGGVAMGAGSAWVCHMLKEPGNPSCWPGVLTVGVIAAGVGAAAGASIDASLARNRGHLTWRGE